VLSAGVPFDQFTDIIRIASGEGGASGFIAGRSVWREVVSLVGHQRQEFLTSVALPRLERLIDVAERSARPWTDVGRARAGQLADGELNPGKTLCRRGG
jgi:tagatose-1,6-bisphosphate aldolase